MERSNKVMQVALGRSASDEIRPCIFKAFKVVYSASYLNFLLCFMVLLDFLLRICQRKKSKGTVEVLSDFVVCEEGKPLSQKSSRILCPLGIKLAISNSTWSADGALMTLSLTEKAWISRIISNYHLEFPVLIKHFKLMVS
ncbi:hypothetical protein Bca52824_061968 [Brassica carinata]|uniref:Uncharacterized protein n=1 Tax=Brassica carinata TaxID=52824 RepID=A0A8X7QCH7_BRACI|nr:hypothetical protein Bca52824_061968 [Brassica carinata]